MSVRWTEEVEMRSWMSERDAMAKNERIISLRTSVLPLEAAVPSHSSASSLLSYPIHL
jgi:hypothetical protein